MRGGGRQPILAVLAVLALLAPLAGCGASDDADETTPAGSGATTAPAATTSGQGTTASEGFTLDPGADGCDHREPPQRERKTYDTAPTAGLDPARQYRLDLQTSCGMISVALDQKLGGAVTEAVAALARDGFYDGLAFHRVVPDFVLQGGDPEGNGRGGPGFTVTDPPPADYAYRPGDMAMAKAMDEPAGAAGSQFFLVSTQAGAQALGQPGQPALYAVVGHAADAVSMATIGRIDALGQGDGPPAQPVYIVRATLSGG